ncbi:ribosome hibernation-promoting factor, HPF/YfiA family [Stackebrandtia soli]|uniref:ribosome hibernation-promoting factor, HPF/YfiA family n=1 Tax=Stackebrandtia soli TaxID=1892856 RepID=UPI0039EA1B38
MEIVVKGRNVEVPDHYRQLVEEKLRKKIDKYDQKVVRVDVELLHEPNRRQHDQCQRVEITFFTRGAIIRAEARAKDFLTAWEVASDKIEGRMRRSADRRRIHRGRRTPVSVGQATAALVEPDNSEPAPISEDVDPFDGLVEEYLPGKIVREKDHPGDPMTVDDALFHMELVGHDFYLFNDKESGRPTVVYRRKGFDYGLLRLEI